MVTSERLTIDTPEQVVLDLPLAGLGSRFLALAMDTVIQALLVVVAALVLGIASIVSGAASLVGPAWTVALIVLLLFCVYWGYFAAFEILWRGQTPGKRLAGVRVIKDSGRPADATALLLRNLLRAVDLLPAMYAVGIVSMLVTRDSRRIGDLVAGTVVVHDRPLDAVTTLESMRPGASTIELPATLRLSDEELALVETYLARRLELPLAVQEQSAERIARLVRERYGVGPEAGRSLDDFLEGVVRHTRDSARYR